MSQMRRGPSPSLHEAVVDRHFEREPGTDRPMPDAALSALSEAMASGRAAAEKARRVADALLANEMETVPARHRRVRDECWKIAEPALRRFDDAIARVRAELGDIERRTAAPPGPRDVAATMLASEIRARLASLAPETRRRALRGALEAGDDTLHAALLGGPAMLSGMEPAELEVLRSAWREARHGPEAARGRRLTAALDDVDRGGGLLVAYVSSLTESDSLIRAEASERAALTALEG